MSRPINSSSWEINKTTFDSLHETWKQACTVSHAVRGNLRTSRQNPSTVHLVCKQLDCPFTFYVSHDKGKAAYILRRLNLHPIFDTLHDLAQHVPMIGKSFVTPEAYQLPLISRSISKRPQRSVHERYFGLCTSCISASDPFAIS